MLYNSTGRNLLGKKLLLVNTYKKKGTRRRIKKKQIKTNEVSMMLK